MDTAHIWLGRFADESALNEYFVERLDDDDDVPINQFASDQGVTFYDHDWVEYGYNNSGDLQALMAGHSYASSYSQKVMEIVCDRTEFRHIHANTFIMADHTEIPTPRSCQQSGYTFWNVGAFELTP